MTLIGVGTAATATSIHVAVRREAGATVVDLSGVAGAQTPDAAVGPGLRLVGHHDSIVVDVNGLTLLDGQAVHRLVDLLQEMLVRPGGRVALVCGRSTARNLLRAWRLHERCAIFPTLEAALNPEERDVPSLGITRRPWVGVSGDRPATG